MYRIDVWYRPLCCFCPGVNSYPDMEAAKVRAARMRAVGHRVKIVPIDSKKYTK